jgi:hypothetical protein
MGSVNATIRLQNVKRVSIFHIVFENCPNSRQTSNDCPLVVEADALLVSEIKWVKTVLRAETVPHTRDLARSTRMYWGAAQFEVMRVRRNCVPKCA